MKKGLPQREQSIQNSYFSQPGKPPPFELTPPSQSSSSLSSSLTSHSKKREEDFSSSSLTSYDPDRRPLIFFWANPSSSSSFLSPTASNQPSFYREYQFLGKETKYIPCQIQRKDLSGTGKDKLASERMFARDIARKNPVVYVHAARRLIKNYELFSDFELLYKQFGQFQIPVSLLQACESLPPFRKEFTTFGEYLLNIRQSIEYARSYYLQQLNLIKYIPQLISLTGTAVKGPSSLSQYLRQKNCNGPTLFIGARGTRTSLHFDRSYDVHPPEEAKSSSEEIRSNTDRARANLLAGNNGSKGGPMDGRMRHKNGATPFSSSNSSTATFTTSSSVFSSISSSPSIISQSSSHSTHTNQSAANHNNHHTANTSTILFPRSSSTVAMPEAGFDVGKHNLFLQVSGSRRFILFPVECTEDLLPSKGTPWPHVSKSTTFVHSVLEYSSSHDLQIQFILNSPYPSLAKAWPHRVEVILNAGEALLIPARWWHCTEILSSGTAVNWWFLVDEEMEEKIRSNTTTIEIPVNEAAETFSAANHSNHSYYSLNSAGEINTNHRNPSQPHSLSISQGGSSRSDNRKENLQMMPNQMRRKVYTDWEKVENHCPIS